MVQNCIPKQTSNSPINASPDEIVYPDALKSADIEDDNSFIDKRPKGWLNEMAIFLLWKNDVMLLWRQNLWYSSQDLCLEFHYYIHYFCFVIQLYISSDLCIIEILIQNNIFDLNEFLTSYFEGLAKLTLERLNNPIDSSSISDLDGTDTMAVTTGPDRTRAGSDVITYCFFCFTIQDKVKNVKRFDYFSSDEV